MVVVASSCSGDTHQKDTGSALSRMETNTGQKESIPVCENTGHNAEATLEWINTQNLNMSQSGIEPRPQSESESVAKCERCDSGKEGSILMHSAVHTTHVHITCISVFYSVLDWVTLC